jgi:hypothetical protein
MSWPTRWTTSRSASVVRGKLAAFLAKACSSSSGRVRESWKARRSRRCSNGISATARAATAPPGKGPAAGAPCSARARATLSCENAAASPASGTAVSQILRGD